MHTVQYKPSTNAVEGGAFHMGAHYYARCWNCDHVSNGFLGGFITTAETQNAYPAFCRSCRHMISIDREQEPAVCPDCSSANIVFYDSEELIGEERKLDFYHQRYLVYHRYVMID